MKSFTAKPFRAWLPGTGSGDTILEGARVRLRPPMESDWMMWAAVRRGNKERLVPLEPTWPQDALSEHFFRRRVAAQRQDWQEGRACAFLIWLKDGRLAGGFNLNHVSRGALQQATLGYWLSVEQEGQGLMQEAARLAIDFAFNSFMLHRLQAATLPHNERSQALLTRLGFIEEGFARGYVQINGVWEDHKLFGLTVEDWRAGKD